jgi:hypothetical protein
LESTDEYVAAMRSAAAKIRKIQKAKRKRTAQG